MQDQLEVQGHRGARGEIAENTLPSFESALDACVDSIETDVHLTADGEVVLWHDPILNARVVRLIPGCQAPDQPLAISRLTLDAIRRFRANGNPDPGRFPDQKAVAGQCSQQFAEQNRIDPLGIPTLGELFLFALAYAGGLGERTGKSPKQREFAARVVFDLELKRVPFYPESIGDGVGGKKVGLLEEKVVTASRTFGLVNRTVVRSFDHRSVKRIREMEPLLTGAILVADTALVDPVSAVKEANASIYCPSYAFVDGNMVKKLKNAGIRVLVWTANEEPVWQRLMEIGVDGITTDFPHRLAGWLGRSRK